MSVKTEPVPPSPDHTPPLEGDAGTADPGRRLSHAWSRWFVSLREKVNVINEQLASLSQLIGSGFVAVDGGDVVQRSIKGTAERISVTDGDGVGDDPTIDVVTTDLIAGSNISFTGSGDNRIIDNGYGPLTINASGGGGGGGDPVVGNRASLLHLDGINGSTTFTDVAGKTWTASGAAQLSTAQARFGSASLLCGASNYISASHQDLSLQNRDFTIECFVYITALPGTIQGIFIGGAPFTSNNNRAQIIINTSNQLQVTVTSSSGSALDLTGPVVSLNTWYHIALTKSGTVVCLFLDGVLTTSGTFSGAQVPDNNFFWGVARAGGAAVYFNGYIDEARITKGFSRYSVDFTPPSTPFPDN